MVFLGINSQIDADRPANRDKFSYTKPINVDANLITDIIKSLKSVLTVIVILAKNTTQQPINVNAMITPPSSTLKLINA